MKASATIFGPDDREQEIWFEYEVTEKSKGVLVEILSILTPMLFRPTDLYNDLQTALAKILNEEIWNVEVKIEEEEMMFI